MKLIKYKIVNKYEKTLWVEYSTRDRGHELYVYNKSNVNMPTLIFYIHKNIRIKNAISYVDSGIECLYFTFLDTKIYLNNSNLRNFVFEKISLSTETYN